MKKDRFEGRSAQMKYAEKYLKRHENKEWLQKMIKVNKNTKYLEGGTPWWLTSKPIRYMKDRIEAADFMDEKLREYYNGDKKFENYAFMTANKFTSFNHGHDRKTKAKFLQNGSRAIALHQIK